MADNRMITPGAARLSDVPPSSVADVPPHRGELAQRLRDARDFGSPGDADDRLAEFELVGRRGADATRREVSLTSPVGGALIGVLPGDVARVALPSGRARMLRVLDVTGGPLAAESAPFETAVEAA